MVYSQKAAEHTDLRPGLILIPYTFSHKGTADDTCLRPGLMC